MIGALALLLVAVIATVTCVSWIWNKAEAISSVNLPTASGAPVETVTPSVRPSSTPPPVGKVVGTEMVAVNKDRMPLLSSAWSNHFNQVKLAGGVGISLTVHDNYAGSKQNWINYVGFGALAKTITYKNTPAGRKEATIMTAESALYDLYGKDVKLLGKATHRAITVQGRPGHELTVKVEVKVPKLKETFSTLAVAVVDRGDGTAAASVADFAGSTPQWLPIWRAKVKQITVSR